jgi:hypothetical protein
MRSAKVSLTDRLWPHPSCGLPGSLCTRNPHAFTFCTHIFQSHISPRVAPQMFSSPLLSLHLLLTCAWASGIRHRHTPASPLDSQSTQC